MVGPERRTAVFSYLLVQADRLSTIDHSNGDNVDILPGGEGEHLLEARCDDDAALRPADALYVVVRNKNHVHYSISSSAASCSLGMTPCETDG